MKKRILGFGLLSAVLTVGILVSGCGGKKSSGGEKSDNANLTSVSIGEATVTTVGTGNADIANVTAGSYSVPAEANANLTVTPNAADEKAAALIAKYASGETADAASFSGVPSLTEQSFVEGDFLIVRVTAEDGTALYYRVNISVTIPALDYTLTSGNFSGAGTAANVSFFVSNKAVATLGTIWTYTDFDDIEELLDEAVTKIVAADANNWLYAFEFTEAGSGNVVKWGVSGAALKGNDEDKEIEITLDQDPVKDNRAALSAINFDGTAVGGVGAGGNALNVPQVLTISLELDEDNEGVTVTATAAGFNATIKMVRYEHDDTPGLANFTAALDSLTGQDFDEKDFGEEDYVIIQVTAEDGATVSYYRVDVVVFNPNWVYELDADNVDGETDFDNVKFFVSGVDPEGGDFPAKIYLRDDLDYIEGILGDAIEDNELLADHANKWLYAFEFDGSDMVLAYGWHDSVIIPKNDWAESVEITLLPASLNDDATLSAITVDGEVLDELGPGGTLDSPTVITVTLIEADTDLDDIDISAEASDSEASILMLLKEWDFDGTIDAGDFSGGSAELTGASVYNGDFVMIQVTAEDGEEVSYYRVNIDVVPAFYLEVGSTGTNPILITDDMLSGGTIGYGNDNQPAIVISANPEARVDPQGTPDEEKTPNAWFATITLPTSLNISTGYTGIEIEWGNSIAGDTGEIIAYSNTNMKLHNDEDLAILSLGEWGGWLDASYTAGWVMAGDGTIEGGIYWDFDDNDTGWTGSFDDISDGVDKIDIEIGHFHGAGWSDIITGDLYIYSITILAE